MRIRLLVRETPNVPTHIYPPHSGALNIITFVYYLSKPSPTAPHNTMPALNNCGALRELQHAATTYKSSVSINIKYANALPDLYILKMT